jgi:hypothetical protein
MSVRDFGGPTRSSRSFLEFDRTRRVDTHYDEFRRYDCFVNHWWHYTDFAGLGDPHLPGPRPRDPVPSTPPTAN